MLNIILIIGVIVAALMIVIVLVQNPKGGGLASNFSSSNQIFGVKRTTEGVEKLTWLFALIILMVSLAASSYNGSNSKEGAAQTDEQMKALMDAKAPKTNGLAPNPTPTPNPAEMQNGGGGAVEGDVQPEPGK